MHYSLFAPLEKFLGEVLGIVGLACLLNGTGSLQRLCCRRLEILAQRGWESWVPWRTFVDCGVDTMELGR